MTAGRKVAEYFVVNFRSRSVGALAPWAVAVASRLAGPCPPPRRSRMSGRPVRAPRGGNSEGPHSCSRSPLWRTASAPGSPRRGPHHQEMTHMRTTSKCAAVAAVTAALTLAACSSGSNSSGSSGNSGNAGAQGTLTWWHNGNTQPLRGTWQQVANAFHAAHPKVSFNINPIQSNDFATKMPVALKSNNPPDIFQQWGGGNEATQVPSGKLANLGPYVSSWIGGLGQAAKSWQVNGVQYGVPYDLHVVGFWYRKDLFNQAGITSPPTTLAALESDDA